MNGPNRNERRHPPVNPLGIPTSPHPDMPSSSPMGTGLAAMHEMYTEAMAAGFSRRDAIALIAEVASRGAEKRACEQCGHTPS